MSYENLLAEARASAGDFAEIRRYIHAHAEVGFDLPHTAEKVREVLVSLGYEPKTCGKSGVVATVCGKKEGSCMLLRADMDALPIKEETELPFAAENGNMHACGHDMHTAMLLCAAQLLKMHENELCGKVVLMFQPAEETLEGAKDMVEAGVLEGVQAALMLHVFSGENVGTGKIVVPPHGVSAPAADYFEINVHGKGCHGAAPQNGRDALLAACHTAVALQGLCAREVGVGAGAVLTIGKMRAGSAANAVAGEAVLSGTMRAFGAQSRATLKERLAKTAVSIAEAFGTSARVSFGSGCPALINNGGLCESVRRYCAELLGEGAVADSSALSGTAGGSEDFAYIAEKVPAVALLLCAGGNGYPLHHPKVVFDESTIPTGGAVYAYTAMRWNEECRMKSAE
ncbi:MAG: amidohydrolase [Clostridia bacterium]|nr:amidohydrolase [Clostridia bacterium]MBQ9710656.1 amidohydrolase [Clostridia bacterium]